MISHILCRNTLETIQEKFEFPFASFPVHYFVCRIQNALTSDDPQTAADMQIVFAVNTEVSEVISDVGIIKIPTACTYF
jgi:hypothetical protein